MQDLLSLKSQLELTSDEEDDFERLQLLRSDVSDSDSEHSLVLAEKKSDFDSENECIEFMNDRGSFQQRFVRKSVVKIRSSKVKIVFRVVMVSHQSFFFLKGHLKPHRVVLELGNDGVFSVVKRGVSASVAPNDVASIALSGPSHSAQFSVTTSAGKTWTFVCPVDEIRSWVTDLKQRNTKVARREILLLFFHVLLR